MATSHFDKHLLIEQIRYMETEHPLACNTEEDFSDHNAGKDFEDRLWLRAKCLVEQHGLSLLLAHAARLSRHVKILIFFVAALLGALGSIYAITDSHTINIYWLLLVLLGFNLLSMLLWLTGIGLNIEGLTSGILARLTGWLPEQLKSRSQANDTGNNKNSIQADRAWLDCHFSGAVGKWQLSKLSHQLWLVYLLTGLGFLVLLLMVRQYDFVWGTTLLSDSLFIKMTAVLSVPLELLGFATPSADLVLETRIGSLPSATAQTLTVEHRYAWAQFLLGSLLCFGIAPRILLWSWSVMMCRRAQNLFTLDYYLPYYINLRQRLMPLASHGEIVDADTSPPAMAETQLKTPVPHALPVETQWVAVELGDNMSWPPASITRTNNLGKVIDRESLRLILQRLQDNKHPVVAVAVSSARSPDRGVQRTIASLMSSSAQRWLVLLKEHEDEPVSSTRLAAWYRLADACNVPADHVITMIMV
ncbi:MAG: DUF2868 domain-containing protein [Proteobacteria bacterium]|nr:DUF2868 domain-containing protein [Pseudomonadota bacterium]